MFNIRTLRTNCRITFAGKDKLQVVLACSDVFSNL